MNKPLLAITMGDATGTGPELTTMALANPEIRSCCRPVIIGDGDTMRQALKITGQPMAIRTIEDLQETQFSDDCIEVLDLNNIDVTKLQMGKISLMTAKAAYEYIKRATELALGNKVDAIVTSAINKEALNNAGFHYDGHTGLLSELCGNPPVTMMLAAGNLRVCHVSTHVSLQEAIKRVRPDRILEVIKLAQEGLERLGIVNPQIAVAGLNPHAGEGGLFGCEEEEFITPAVEKACRKGIKASGPHPGDTVFFRTLQGEFDCAVAMYHDQGHVAAKMLGIWKGVNITLGLPVIRTSVEHGTDFRNAGTGKADPRSLIEAIKLAATMALNQRKI